MTYNLALFIKSFYKSFFHSKGTHAHLTKKRIQFLLLFYLVWPVWTLILWISFFLDHLLFPSFQKEQIQKPLFILGNFRSGSTFLQRLIAQDPQFASPTIWDIFISPSIILTKIFAFLRSVDRIFGNPIYKLLKKIDQHTLGQVDFHKISFFKPEEDENFLLHIWSSSFAGIMFPFMEDFTPYFYFDQQISEPKKTKIMNFYRSCVQRHLFAHPEMAHYLSKNPSFSPKIGSIHQFFPDACIVYLARNPLDMLPSTISWLGYAWHTFNDPLTRYPFSEEIVQFTQHWYRYPLDILSKSDPQSYLIINYNDLVEDPESVIRQIYHQFGYSMSEEFSQTLRKKIAKSRSFHSPHTYSLNEMEITHEQILSDYSDIFERFKFKTRMSQAFEKDQDESITD